MKPPILTVVIPVYNRAAVVGRTLGSLAAQTTRDFEVILVDNNSDDGTAEVLRRWAASAPVNVRVLTQMLPGAAAARQRGLEACTTEWTMFFDSDDTMAPGHIARALDAIAAHPDADLVGWDVAYNEGGRRKVKRFVASPYRSLFNGTMATLRYMARTDIFRRAGGWNPAVATWDDIELGARILELNPKVYKIAGGPMVEVYLQSDSMTATATDAARIEPALRCMAATLGPRRRGWTDLKRAIFAASLPASEGRRYMERLLPVAARPALLRLAYAYTRLGGRGIARILRPFMDR